MILRDVRKQCMNSCGIQSHIAHLENIANKRLDHHYNEGLTLIKHAQRLLADTAAIPKTKNSRVEILRAQTPEKIMTTTAKQGVLLRGQFRLQSKTIQKIDSLLNSITNDAQIKTGPSQAPINKANIVLGTLLKLISQGAQGRVAKQADELIKLLTNDLNSFHKLARQNYVKLFGSSPRFNTYTPERTQVYRHSDQTFTRVEVNLFPTPQSKLIEIQKEPTSRDDIVNHIVETLDSGQSVQLSFVQVLRMVDTKTGLAALDRSLTEALKTSDQIGNNGFLNEGFGHGNLIESYRYDSNGKLTFLVKDSQGTKVYDQGYLHMSADYLKAMVISITTFQK